MVSQIHFVPAGRLINYTYWHFQHKEVHLSIHSFSAVDYLRTSGERTFISWSTHFFSPWLFDPHPASEHPLILISLWGGYLIQDSPHFRCTSLSRTISLLGMSMTTSGLSKVHSGEQPPATPFFSFVLYKFSILARQTITSINQINQIKDPKYEFSRKIGRRQFSTLMVP